MADQTSQPRKTRIVLCMGPFCNHGGQADPLYTRLQQELGDPGPAFMSHKPVTWETANCLSMCGAGPNLIVYPEDTVYHTLDPDALERFINERLRGKDKPDPTTG